jgi:hypothetical protein
MNSMARRLDAQLTRNVITFAFGTPTVGELASARLGCRVRLLSIGDDLAALCPRELGE